jgi:hypothetical protein
MAKRCHVCPYLLLAQREGGQLDHASQQDDSKAIGVGHASVLQGVIQHLSSAASLLVSRSTCNLHSLHTITHPAQLPAPLAAHTTPASASVVCNAAVCCQRLCSDCMVRSQHACNHMDGVFKCSSR